MAVKGWIEPCHQATTFPKLKDLAQISILLAAKQPRNNLRTPSSSWASSHEQMDWSKTLPPMRARLLKTNSLLKFSQVSRRRTYRTTLDSYKMHPKVVLKSVQDPSSPTTQLLKTRTRGVTFKELQPRMVKAATTNLHLGTLMCLFPRMVQTQSSSSISSKIWVPCLLHHSHPYKTRIAVLLISQTLTLPLLWATLILINLPTTSTMTRSVHHSCSNSAIFTLVKDLISPPHKAVMARVSLLWIKIKM